LQFYWNKHLTQPFIDSGQEEFAVPLIQGFVGQREFTADTSPSTRKIADVKTDVQDFTGAQGEVLAEYEAASPENIQPESPNSSTFLITLISRRSVQRAGLRYHRRGVDEEGYVANSVETEQVLCSSSWGSESEKLYSYLQYRGSIPLFFSQSPYSLKPIPVFRGSPESNLEAFKLHFKHLADRYGQIQVASLVDKRGTESSVGHLYETLAEKFNKSTNEKVMPIGFEWFDFHALCRGMKFENVSILFDTIEGSLNSFGWTEMLESKVSKSQTGVLRTNCMDCLDRTNVIQSACGRIILEKQLLDQGITIDLQKDASTSWFNTLWADNGDAISRQYAGTAALKGDFTRTRRRNISGALTDFGLTLSRYYNNIVNDYFTQAVIDFELGKADESIFVDFEADMKAQDYAIDLRKVRQNAIETCANICIEETNENLIAGWVLRCPRISGTLKSVPFEECVLLLTEEALYFCRMDWTVEKTKSFEKIDLDSVEELARGTYITSTFASRDLDETKNVGFIVKYSTRGKDMVRINTRSLTSEGEAAHDSGREEKKDNKPPSGDKFLAFKALPPRSSFVESNGDDNSPSEVDLTRSICEQVARLVNTRRSGSMAREVPVENLSSGDGEDESILLKVKEEDIISVAEAKRSTGYLETMSHVLKKLVWA
jgi:SacI homology domain/Inositol phosphatase